MNTGLEFFGLWEHLAAGGQEHTWLVVVPDETTLPGEVPSSGYSSSDKEGSYMQAPIGIATYHYQGQCLSITAFVRQTCRLFLSNTVFTRQTCTNNRNVVLFQDILPEKMFYFLKAVNIFGFFKI